MLREGPLFRLLALLCVVGLLTGVLLAQSTMLHINGERIKRVADTGRGAA